MEHHFYRTAYFTKPDYLIAIRDLSVTIICLIVVGAMVFGALGGF